MASPAVTIAIPARNAGAWLRGAVESALSQQGIDPQVIVVDDGSTDQSLESLRGLGSGVRVLHQEAQGGNAARNRALEETETDWIQFLDADDYLEPTKISRQLAEAGGASEVEVLYSPVWIETVNGGKGISREVSQIDASSDIFVQWLAWQLPQTAGSLWRTEPLRRLNGWKVGQPCCQEHELYLRALQAGFRFHFCPSPGAVYRIWSEQTVCRRDPVLVIRKRTELIDRMLAWLKANDKLQQAHWHAAAQACFAMARTWARYDLEASTRYFRERKCKDLIRPLGPPAPFSYRVMLKSLGFQTAERLAKIIRPARLASLEQPADGVDRAG